MNKRKNVIAAVIAIIVLLSGGCGAEAPPFGDGVVLSLSDGDVGLEEFTIYTASRMRMCESEYGEDVWNASFLGGEGREVVFAEYVKWSALQDVRMAHVLSGQAASYGVGLSEGEEEELSEAAEALHASYGQAGTVLGAELPLSLIRDILKRNVLADKVYAAIVGGMEEDGIAEEDLDGARLDYFLLTYEKICRQTEPEWDEKRHVNAELVNSLRLEREASPGDDSEEGEVLE